MKHLLLPHRKHFVSNIKLHKLIPFRAIIAVYFLNYRKHTNAMWRENTELFMVKRQSVNIQNVNIQSVISSVNRQTVNRQNVNIQSVNRQSVITQNVNI